MNILLYVTIETHIVMRFLENIEFNNVYVYDFWGRFKIFKIM
jgi:hypothetical protein